MSSINVLGFDLGASSGRAILGSFNGKRLELEEKHRFPNDPVYVCGAMHWDILRLFHEIKQGILQCRSLDVKGISIDTWGVDFGLLDKSGRMLENPVHYRDTRTDGMEELACSRMPRNEIYTRTGIDFMFFNTLFQLLSLAENRRELLDKAETLLYTPDLLKYFLTGEKGNEFTMASTTQILNAKTRKYDEDICRVMNIPSRIFAEIIEPCTITGALLPNIAQELGVGNIPFITTTSHDTAAAGVAVPAEGTSHAFISCGTWSLVGVESDSPLINEKSLKYTLNNYGGGEGKYLPVKNVMGLWLLQEARRQWVKEGEDIGFGELAGLAAHVRPFQSFVDPDDMIFAHPGQMPQKVADYCKQSGQIVPDTKGEIAACIIQSLAMKYRYVLNKLELIAGKKFDVLHIVGGGTQNRLLCQMTANATGCRVVAGPVEATNIGNIVMQLRALGQLNGLSEARQLIRDSFEMQEYTPQDTDQWSEAYATFLTVCEIPE